VTIEQASETATGEYTSVSSSNEAMLAEAAVEALACAITYAVGTAVGVGVS